MYCQQCGAEITGGNQYCRDCGAELGAGAGVEAADESTIRDTQERTGSGESAGQYQPQRDVSGNQYQQRAGTPGERNRRSAHERGTVRQGYQQHGGRPSAGMQSGTLEVRTKADRYLRRFSRFNLALAILAAFFGFLSVVVGNFVQEMGTVPPEVDALFGALYLLLFGFAALYLDSARESRPSRE